MSIQNISLHKFTGGMSDDARIQSDQMFQDIDGFDITEENYLLSPLKDWNQKVNFDTESLIDDSTKDIIFDGSSHWVLTDDASNHARVIRISNLENSSPNISDLTSSTSGTAGDFERGSLVEFNNRAWFITNGHLGWFNLNLLPAGATYEMKYEEFDLPKSYDNILPVVGPTFELWVPNSRIVSTVVPNSTNPDGGNPTFVSEALELPDDITAIDKYGRNGILGTYSREQGSRAWIWNGIDADTTDNYYISNGEVVAFGNVDGTLVALCRNIEDNTTSIYFMRGNGFRHFQTINEEMNRGGRLTINNGGKLYFVTDKSMWVIGSKNSQYEMALSRVARFKLHNSKTSETTDLENSEIHTIFQDNYGIGVIAEHETEESSGVEGIYYIDDDDNYFLEDASVVTQKFRYRDIGQFSQLKHVTESVEWGSASDSSLKVEYRLDSNDDLDFVEIFTATKSEGTSNVSASRKSDGVNFDIGQEIDFRITSNKGTKVKEHMFGISPRQTPKNK